MSTRLVRTLLTATALLVAVAAPVQAGAPGGDPGFHAPTVGQCRDLSMKELAQESDAQATVDCDSRHTARTIAVLDVPASVGWDDHDALVRITEKECQAANSKALGSSALRQAMTAYSWGWFVPTESERASGARWIRCDAILLGGKQLLRLPTDKAPVLPAGRFKDGIARCLLGGDGITTTACSAKHAWRAEGAFVQKQKRYPDDRKSDRVLTKRCGTMVGKGVYRWTYPSKLGWRLGNHVVVCYRQTRR